MFPKHERTVCDPQAPAHEPWSNWETSEGAFSLILLISLTNAAVGLCLLPRWLSHLAHCQLLRVVPAQLTRIKRRGGRPVHEVSYESIMYYNPHM